MNTQDFINENNGNIINNDNQIYLKMNVEVFMELYDFLRFNPTQNFNKDSKSIVFNAIKNSLRVEKKDYIFLRKEKNFITGIMTEGGMEKEILRNNTFNREVFVEKFKNRYMSI
jgi:hypothetical protein